MDISQKIYLIDSKLSYIKKNKKNRDFKYDKKQVRNLINTYEKILFNLRRLEELKLGKSEKKVLIILFNEREKGNESLYSKEISMLTKIPQEQIYSILWRLEAKKLIKKESKHTNRNYYSILSSGFWILFGNDLIKMRINPNVNYSF